jgi:hypothetical protein
MVKHSHNFINRLERWKSVFEIDFKKHWGWLLVSVPVWFLSKLTEHRVMANINDYFDNHHSLASLKPLFAYILPITAAVSVFLLVLLILVIHAYLSSRGLTGKPLVSGLAYDKPIRDAIAYIANKLGRNENYCEAARSLIRQEALNGNLILWGRKQIDPPERFKNSQEFARRFSEVVSVIPSDYWRVSVLSAGALAPRYANAPFTLEENAGGWPKASNAYSDIFVNWQQIQDLAPEGAS